MERKGSKEFSVVFSVEGEKSRLRNLPWRTSSLLCSAAKQKHFVNQKTLSHNCNKRKVETNQCEEMTSPELRTESNRELISSSELGRHIA